MINVILIITIHFFVNTFLYTKYVYGLSSLVYSLAIFVIYISYEVDCLSRIKEYIGNIIIVSIVSLFVLTNIDLNGHLIGICIGIFVLIAKIFTFKLLNKTSIKYL